MKTTLIRILAAGLLAIGLGALCAIPARADSAMLSLDNSEWTFADGQRDFSVSTDSGYPLIRSGLTPIVECGPENARTATLQFSESDSLELRRCEIPPTVSAALPCATGDTFDVACAFADNEQRLRFRLMVQQAYRARFPLPVAEGTASTDELGQLVDVVGEVLAGLINGFDYSTVLNLLATVESLSDSLGSGTESVPVARPPTPPLAPLPFQSETIEVALGESGQNAGLMTTESGGFTLNGEAFESGGSVILQADDTVVAKRKTAIAGREYLLTFGEDGIWTAAFQPMEVSVALGVSGDSVSLYTTEAGGFTRNGRAFGSGDTVTARNGDTYRLRLGNDGVWTAVLVQP